MEGMSLDAMLSLGVKKLESLLKASWALALKSEKLTKQRRNLYFILFLFGCTKTGKGRNTVSFLPCAGIILIRFYGFISALV
jgi:hypothetical protein